MTTNKAQDAQIRRMAEAGFTQAEIARQTGVHYSTISKAFARLGITSARARVDWSGTGVRPAPGTRLALGLCSLCTYTNSNPELLLDHLDAEHGVKRIKTARDRSKPLRPSACDTL